MPLSVIIPSKTWSNLKPCVDAVRSHEPDYRIVVSDDGIDPMRRVAMGYNDHSISFIDGVKPFIFARNVNLGIGHALKDAARDVTFHQYQRFTDGPEGFVLLNDDAILQTPGGFSLMAQACREHPEYGLISATTNLAGNPQQRPQGVGLREAQRVVAFVCVYIPRTTIERVGLLDERFTAYGWEDNDYCRRVRDAGLKLGVHDGCYVDHGSLKSTFRGDPKAAGDIRGGAAIYRAKWGDLG